MRVEALHAHSGAADAALGLGDLGAHRREEATIPVVVVRALQVLGVDESLVTVDAAAALEAADRVVQLGVHQPEERRHWRAVTQVRLVLDHDRAAVDSTNDHRAATRERATKECFDVGEVFG